MQKLVQGLHKFRTEIYPGQRELYDELANGQSPDTLFITCSDSRISPNQLTQTEPGDLFILRNAGNLIPAYNGNQVGGEGATIEFAIVELGVKHIVVCGHTLCGAMKALLHPEKLSGVPQVAKWLAHAEPTRRLVEENYAHLDEADRTTVMAEENVLLQIENLRTHPAVRAKLARGELSLHAWVFKIQTAEIYQFNSEKSQFELFAGKTSSVERSRPMRRLDAVAI
jgi:carbonic anhydrase